MDPAFSELAKYGSAGVAIAAIAALVYITTKFLKVFQSTQNIISQHTTYLKTRDIKTTAALEKVADRLDDMQVVNTKLVEKIDAHERRENNYAGRSPKLQTR